MEIIGYITGERYKFTSLRERLAVENADNIPDRAFSIDYSKYYSWLGKNSGRYAWRSETKPSIKKVIFNPPATIVFWNDGTKTVVKAQNEVFDWEKGLAMAICKKLLTDGRARYYDIFREYEKAGIDAEYKEAIKNLVSGEDIMI